MSELVLDTVLIVVMLVVLNWRESRLATRSISLVRPRVLPMGGPPMLRDAARRRETLEAMDRKAS